MTVASAPGRVNLIGEHTDYNEGYVLPTTIPQRTHVVLVRQEAPRIHVYSRSVEQHLAYDLGEELRTNTWLDYVQGVTAMLRVAGLTVGGADIVVTSEVPLGGGLSSSASLTVALLRAFREEFAFELDDLALAMLAQRVETDFVGVPVGAMDQIASSLGKQGEALLVDMRSLASWPVVLPLADLVVISSGIKHDHSVGGYRTRRYECLRACTLLGLSSLRDLEEMDYGRVTALPSPLERRVRHVVTENARVLAAVHAITENDLATLGTLLRASHASLRDDYEVSVPAIDVLVDIGDHDPDVYGTRLTGGGFGGSVVALARRGHGRAAAERMTATYRQVTGHEPRILVAGGPP